MLMDIVHIVERSRMLTQEDFLIGEALDAVILKEGEMTKQILNQDDRIKEIPTLTISYILSINNTGFIWEGEVEDE